ADGCIVSSLDADAKGERLLVAFTDGSAWRVDADGSATMLAAPTCSNPRTDGRSCADVKVHLSPIGRYGVIASKTVTGFDFVDGVQRTLDYKRDCDIPEFAEAKESCLRQPASVLLFKGEDEVLLVRHGKRVKAQFDFRATVPPDLVTWW